MPGASYTPGWRKTDSHELSRPVIICYDGSESPKHAIRSAGLTGVRSMLLGSVSNAVVHHTERATLVVPKPQ